MIDRAKTAIKYGDRVEFKEILMEAADSELVIIYALAGQFDVQDFTSLALDTMRKRKMVL